MAKGRSLIVLAVLVGGLTVVGGAAARKPHQPFHRALGVRLSRSVEGVCAVRAPATTRHCTVQGDAKIERVYGFGRYPHVPGHIVRFRLTSGRLSAHTTAVKVRFRAIGASGGGAGGQVSRWFDLPRGGRQLREFPVNVPFPPGSRVGLDVVVTGDGSGEATAPLAGAEGVLNLNAVFEQDDQTPPVLHFTYSKRQDFLHTRRVFIHVRSDEFVLFNPECGLLAGNTEWALLGAIPHLRAGRWTTYFCELEPPAVNSGRRSLLAGHDPRVLFRLVAWDRARNVARTKAFYVRPTRP
jgi:hypothetical protein